MGRWDLHLPKSTFWDLFKETLTIGIFEDPDVDCAQYVWFLPSLRRHMCSRWLPMGIWLHNLGHRRTRLSKWRWGALFTAQTWRFSQKNASIWRVNGIRISPSLTMNFTEICHVRCKIRFHEISLKFVISFWNLSWWNLSCFKMKCASTPI